MPNFISFLDAGINVGNKTAGHIDTTCPNCSLNRKPENRKKPCLSVDISNKKFNCHHCGFAGHISDNIKMKKDYTRPIALPPIENPINQEWAEYFFKRRISVQSLKKVGCQTIEKDIQEEGKWVKRSVISFPYKLNGELYFYKYRGIDKRMSMSKGAELIPFNIDCLQGKEKIPYLIWTEGEIDALTWIENKKEFVVSVPNGANKNNPNLEFLDRVFDLLEKVDTHYLAIDDDEAGRVLLDALSRRLDRAKCKVVKYNGYKDINELAMSDCNVNECYDKATWFPIKGIEELSDFEKELDDSRASGQPKFLKLHIPSLDEFFTWNRGKAVTTISAKPQSAKSQFVFNVIVRLAYFHGMKFGVFSPETGNSVEVTQRLLEILIGQCFFKDNTWRLPQMSQSMYEWGKGFISNHFYFVKESDLEDMTFKGFLSYGAMMVKKYGINGLVADPYNVFEGAFGGKGEGMSNSLNEQLTLANSFCAKYDVHLMVVPHPIALRGEDTMTDPYQINGGAAWFNKSDNILLMNRNFATGNYREGIGDTISVAVKKCKKNFAGKTGEVTLSYHVATGRFGTTNIYGNVEFQNYVDFEKIKQSGDKLELDLPKPSLHEHLADRETKLDTELGIYVPINAITLPTQIDEECPF